MSKHTVGGRGDWELPPEGTFPAVCTQIIEKKNVQTKFGVKDRAGYIFVIDKRGSNGKQLSASVWVNDTMGKGSSQLSLIETWLGRKLPVGEEFETKVMEGAPGMITIQHSDDGQFANILSCVPLPEGMEPPVLDPPEEDFSPDDAPF